MDDFVVSAFLSSGSATDTVPVRIYSNARGAPTPALNALASLTLGITIVALAARVRPVRGSCARPAASADSGLADLAGLGRGAPPAARSGGDARADVVVLDVAARS